MLAAIADGDSKIGNYSTGADCRSTLGCVRALGIGVEKTDSEVVIHGQGPQGLRAPEAQLDAGQFRVDDTDAVGHFSGAEIRQRHRRG